MNSGSSETPPPRSERFFDRIASNVVTLLMGRFLQKILSFILLWFMVRWWTMESFGHYSFLMTWIGLAAGISDMGMTLLGVRLWAENPERMAVTLPRFYGLRLAFIALGILVSIPIWIGFYGHLPFWGLALIILGSLPQVQGVAMIPFQAELNNRPPMIWSNINRALTIAVIIMALLMGAGVPIVIGLEILLPLFLLAKLVREAGRIAVARRGEAPAYSLRELFADLGPAGALVLLSMLFFRADIFLLMQLAGEKAVGLYAASFRVVEPLLTLPGVLAMTLIPVTIARYAAQDHESLWRSVRRAARVTTLMQLALAFALARYAAVIVRVVFGAAYEPTGPMMAVLVWTLPLSAWSYAWSMGSMAERRYARLIALAAAALILNVVGNILAIPQFGGYGCAVVTVFTELLWSLGQSLPYARHGGWRIAGGLLASLVAAWGCSFAVDTLWSGVVGQAVATFAGLAGMAALAWAFRLVTHDDMDGIRSYVKSIRTR